MYFRFRKPPDRSSANCVAVKAKSETRTTAHVASLRRPN
jgi:hypothetical protein